MLIHVGIGKSGTSALQTLVFNKHPKVQNFGRPNDHEPEYRAFLSAVTDGLTLGGSSAVATYLQAMEQRASAEGKVAVLSDEKLTAQIALLSGIAMRLRHAMPDAQILITTRNQVDAIASYYANHGRVLKSAPNPYRGKHVTFRDWWSHAKANWQSGYPASIAYWDIARLFIDAFGAANVHVLQFEERVRDHDRFAEKLAPLLSLTKAEYLAIHGADKGANPRDSERLVRYHRLRRLLPLSGMSKWLPGHRFMVKLVDRQLKKGKAHVERIPDDILAEIVSLYGAQNQALARAFNLDLESYGYPLAPIADHETLRKVAAELARYVPDKKVAA